MGGASLALDRLTECGADAPEDRRATTPAPACDRFAGWTRTSARIALATFALLVLVALASPLRQHGDLKAPPPVGALVPGQVATSPAREPERFEDLALYDTAIARISRGEAYYDFIVAEHRSARYPVRPGVAVRLPTLAYIDAALGSTGQAIAAVLLMIAVVAAWWRRLGEVEGVGRHRLLATALVFLGASVGLTRMFFVLHELWAGMLLALAFALYRPGEGRLDLRFGVTLAVTALALAIRELALPFVLLAGASALWHRHWREAACWGALVALFAIGMAWHLAIVAAQITPADPAGQGWLALHGIAGWLSKIVLSSNLRFLPDPLAAALLLAAMLGWAGWRTPTGSFGFLLFFGYGFAFSIAGRWDNYYWGAMVAPAMLAGLVFAPRGLVSLWRAARAGERAEPRTA